jgi:hypothetical protein
MSAMTLHQPSRAPLFHTFARSLGSDGAQTQPASILEFPDADSVEVRDQLEELDDAMFAAIDGTGGAFEKARLLWFNAIASLPWGLVEESRDQYLRYAAEVTRLPGKSDTARDVMELLARAA